MTEPYEAVRDALSAFVAERDWSQFHTPANLSKSIAIESAELLECFQWSDHFDKQAVRHELADVLTYAYLLAEALGVDPGETVLEKLAITKEKYPVSKAFGRNDKYDQLSD